MVKRTRSCLGALAFAASLVFAAPAQGDGRRSTRTRRPARSISWHWPKRARTPRAGRGGGTDGGTGAYSDGSTGEAPQFGVVVEPSSRSAEPPKTGVTSGTDRCPATSVKVKPDETTAAATADTVRAQAPAPHSGGDELVAVGAGAGGVLLLGGLAGLLLRRRSIGGCT